MGSAVSKGVYVREELKMLQGDLQELKNERDTTVGRVEALEKELRHQRKMLQGLDIFARETLGAIAHLEADWGEHEFF